MNSEFTRTSLDSSLWRTGWFGSGVTSAVNNWEEDCYSPDQVSLPGDGTLHLAVRSTPSSCNGVTQPYTGALISSNPDDGRSSGGFQYTYGLLEARVYVPASGPQIADWPAVWTDGQQWPADGENDIMEGLSGQTCFHFQSALGGPGDCVSNITPGWHTFASDWERNSVTYYYDGLKVGSLTQGITSAPMYIVLDNTVSSQWLSLAHDDDMQVSYVRVWQR